MTLPAGTITTPPVNSGGEPVFDLLYPDGYTPTGYRIAIFKQADINAAGRPSFWSVGGTKDGSLPYSLRGQYADWVLEQNIMSFTANETPPSSRALSNGDYTAIFDWRSVIQTENGLLDDTSLPAIVDFEVQNSNVVDVPRTPLDRVYALPRPRITYPAEGATITLAQQSDNMYFDFEIPILYNPEAAKVAVYVAGALDDNIEGPRGGVRYGTDDKDGDGWNTGAEWVPIGQFQRLSGATPGYHKYRITAEPTLNKFNARMADGFWGVRIRYYSDGGDLVSVADQAVFELRNSNANPPPEIYTNPQSTNPLFPEIIMRRTQRNAYNEANVLPLRWLYLTATGLGQIGFLISRRRRTSPTNAAVLTDSIKVNNENPNSFRTWGSGASNFIRSPLPQIDLPVGGPDIEDRWGKASYGFPTQDGKRYIQFQVIAQDAAEQFTDSHTSITPYTDVFVYASIEIRTITATYNSYPNTSRTPQLTPQGSITLVATAFAPDYPDVRQCGNRPEKVKFAIYNLEDIDPVSQEPIVDLVDGVGVPRRPVGYTSDYKNDPVFGNRAREYAESFTGAEWVEAESTLLSNNAGWTITPTGGLRFGDDAFSGGDPATRTFGRIDNGDYVIRGRMRDRWGNESPLFVTTLTVSGTEPLTVNATPAVYDLNDMVVIDPATNMPYTEGLVRGRYVCISLEEVADSTKGLPSFVEVQRREYERLGGAPVSDEIVTIPGRYRVNQQGNYPLVLDRGLELDVQYEWRAVSFRNPGIQVFGPWSP